MKNMNLKRNKQHTILIGDIVILIAGLLISLIVLLCGISRKAGDRVEITVNGKVEIYALADDETIPISSKQNGYNEVVIEDGKVYMKEANCRDQICVRHKAISKNGESIICLPHGVYVEVVSSQEKEIDN